MLHCFTQFHNIICIKVLRLQQMAGELFGTQRPLMTILREWDFEEFIVG